MVHVGSSPTYPTNREYNGAMVTLLVVIPWVLTVVALMTIMFISKKERQDEPEIDLDLEDGHEIIRVSIQENKAYWVYDNVLYESEVTREPDFETARPIDVMSLSAKQMKELFEILDDLEKSKEGEV